MWIYFEAHIDCKNVLYCISFSQTKERKSERNAERIWVNLKLHFLISFHKFKIRKVLNRLSFAKCRHFISFIWSIYQLFFISIVLLTNLMWQNVKSAPSFSNLTEFVWATLRSTVSYLPISARSNGETYFESHLRNC